MKNVITKNTNTKKKLGFFRKASLACSAIGAASAMTAVTAFADTGFDDSVTVQSGTNVNASTMMGKIIGILLTITRFVGVALVIYGVYEVVMSFMQNQPEAKTKGIIMALAGVVMIALKSVLKSIGIIG